MVKKKVNHKGEEKMHLKVKMTSQRAENLVYAQQHLGKHFLQKKCFQILLDIADMAIWMSKFDNFDIGQKPSKFAQR